MPSSQKRVGDIFVGFELYTYSESANFSLSPLNNVPMYITQYRKTKNPNPHLDKRHSNISLSLGHEKLSRPVPYYSKHNIKFYLFTFSISIRIQSLTIITP